MNEQAAGGNFVRLVYERLEQLGWKPIDLAREAGMSTGHVYNMLGGKRPPTRDTIEKVAAALTMSFDQLKAAADTDKLGPEGIGRLKVFALGINERIDESTAKLSELKSERATLMAGEITEAVEKRIAEVDVAIAEVKRDLIERAKELKTARAELDEAVQMMTPEEQELVRWLRQFTPEQISLIRKLTPEKIEALRAFMG